jgi:GNAT superfamily N-acetyltransferase
VMETRYATAEDVEAMAHVLAAAFQDDPGTKVFEPDPEARRRFVPAFFRTFLRASLADGGELAVPAGYVTGVAVWFGPDRYGPSDEALAAHGLGDALDILGPAGTDRLLAMIGELETRHERWMAGRPHLRLEFLGVAPEMQRHGIGTALVDVGHRRADERELPCYLETFTIPNVHFYERRGYSVVVEYTVGEGVPVYGLERPAQRR